MESNVISIIKLIEGGKVLHTIKIENVKSYKFFFDSTTLATLFLTADSLRMRDLDMLLAKPYEAYAVMGVKRIVQNGQEENFEIPARAFKSISVVEDGEKIEIKFYDNVG